MGSIPKKHLLKACLVAVALAGPVALAQDRAEAESVVSSYYVYALAGLATASGAIFDPAGYTAASPYLPMGTQLRVTYWGRSVVVTVNDRGPYVGGRQLDLSRAAAEAIGLTGAGTGVVDVQVVG